MFCENASTKGQIRLVPKARRDSRNECRPVKCNVGLDLRAAVAGGRRWKAEPLG